MSQREISLPGKLAGFAVRPGPGGDGKQVLLFVNTSPACVRSLDGGQGGSDFTLGANQKLTDAATNAPWQPTHRLGAAAYDSFTKCTYFFHGYALMRLDAKNTVALVAGSATELGYADGEGAVARFDLNHQLVADGQGALYVTSKCGHVMRIKVPAGEGGRAGAFATVTVYMAATTAAAAGKPLLKFRSLAYDSLTNQLLAGTQTALYSLGFTSYTGGVPALLAGGEGSPGNCDGSHTQARFNGIARITSSFGTGIVHVHQEDGLLRSVDLATGSFLTFAGGEFPIPGDGEGFRLMGQLSHLPLRYLMLRSYSSYELILLRVSQLKACSGPEPSLPAAARPRQTSLLLPHLLLKPNDKTAAAVDVRVGNTVFAIHRTVLVRSSDYFRSLLEGGFTEGAAAEVVLSDTDPDDFAALLSYMYTGALQVPEERLRSVAALAGWLLMDDVSSQLQGRLLAAACSNPGSMLADLMWAERHNMRLLAAGLKATVVNCIRAVARATPLETFQEFTAEWPELSAEMFKMLGS